MKVSYVNYRKKFPTIATNSFKSWFSFKRYWSGKLIYFNFKHHSVVLDLRGDLFYELTCKRYKTPQEQNDG